MSIPVILRQGIVSIYGAGSADGINGIIPPPGYIFGIIDQVWNGGTMPPYIGDSVMFKAEDVTKLIYSNWPYLLIDETKIVITEEPLL